MIKKIWVYSIIAAVLMIMLPISSVVGNTLVKSNDEKEVNSPLFAIRQQTENKLSSSYLGKGSFLSIFVKNKITYDNQIDRTLRFIKQNPTFLKKLLDKIQSHPEIEEILNENDISLSEFNLYSNSLKDNPLLLEKDLIKIEKYIADDTSLPLGINSTNPFAILILVIVLLPLILTLGIMIATMTIITCLNIRGCFETLMQNMLDSFVQGLKQPDN